MFNDANLKLDFNSQIWRARDGLGLWGRPGAGKAVRVGFCGSSSCAGVAKSAGPRAAEWLFLNLKMDGVEIWRVVAVGGVASVALGMAGKVGPGGDETTSRLMVYCVVLPREIEVRY